MDEEKVTYADVRVSPLNIKRNTCKDKNEERHHEIHVNVLVTKGTGRRRRGVDGVIIAKEDADNDDGSNLPEDGKYDEKEGVFRYGLFGLVLSGGLDLGLRVHSVNGGMFCGLI